jgi:hypothetical protein
VVTVEQANQMPNESFEPNDRQEQMLDLLKDGREEGDPWGRITVKYAVEQLDDRRQYVNRDLGSLVDAGWVRKPVKGLYEFVVDPREDTNGNS